MAQALIPQIGKTYSASTHPSVSDYDTTEYETYSIGTRSKFKILSAIIRRGKTFLMIQELDNFNMETELLKVGENLYQCVGGESVAYSFHNLKG